MSQPAAANLQLRPRHPTQGAKWNMVAYVNLTSGASFFVLYHDRATGPNR